MFRHLHRLLQRDVLCEGGDALAQTAHAINHFHYCFRQTSLLASGTHPDILDRANTWQGGNHTPHMPPGETSLPWECVEFLAMSMIFSF